jgi:hypothetical protein
MNSSVKLIGIAILALAASLADASDLLGFTTTDDATCAVDANCASLRGGVSDVMTLYAPNGSVADRIFAFGNEEGGNLYFFANVDVDPSQFTNFTQIVDNNGTVGDQFGVADLTQFGLGLKLGFDSDTESFNFGAPIPGIPTLSEIIGGNPNHWILEPGSSTMTIEYDATLYLSAALQAAGYRATFQSDVPEPASLALLSIGALAAFPRRKRSAA